MAPKYITILFLTRLGNNLRSFQCTFSGEQEEKSVGKLKSGDEEEVGHVESPSVGTTVKVGALLGRAALQSLAIDRR